MIKISLILPAYNTADYLQKCILSCESQNIPKDSYEIIIVNDGSTDTTLDIAQDLKTKFENIIILSQENQGLSQARNNGVKIARGEYIWFIDSDDVITQNCLKSIVEVMDNLRLDMFGVGPSIPFKSVFPKNFTMSNDTTPIYTGHEWILNGPQFIGAWAYVFRKTFWTNNDFSFYPGICFEDTEFIPKACFKATKICSLSTFSCYSYIQRAGSIINSPISEKKIFDISKIINSYSEFITDINTSNNKDIIHHFKQFRSSQLLSGINHIVKLKDLPMLKRWLSTIPKHKKTLYGKNLIENIYQYIALNHPIFYFYIRYLF